MTMIYKQLKRQVIILNTNNLDTLAVQILNLEWYSYIVSSIPI